MSGKSQRARPLLMNAIATKAGAQAALSDLTGPIRLKILVVEMEAAVEVDGSSCVERS